MPPKNVSEISQLEEKYFKTQHDPIFTVLGKLEKSTDTNIELITMHLAAEQAYYKALKKLSNITIASNEQCLFELTGPYYKKMLDDKLASKERTITALQRLKTDWEKGRKTFQADRKSIIEEMNKKKDSYFSFLLKNLEQEKQKVKIEVNTVPPKTVTVVANRHAIQVLEERRKIMFETVDKFCKTVKSCVEKHGKSVESTNTMIRSWGAIEERDGQNIQNAFSTEKLPSSLKFDAKLLESSYENGKYSKSEVIYEGADLIFGVNLQDYEKQHGRSVPLTVIKCIESIKRQGGLQVEGIYRLEGRSSDIERLKYNLEKNEAAVLTDEYKVHVLSNVLKAFLKDLSEPLLKMSSSELNEYEKIEKPEEVLALLKEKITKLPSAEYATLNIILHHLVEVSRYESDNRMSVKTLSLMFCPAIFHIFTDVKSINKATSILENLIKNYALLYPNVGALYESEPSQSSRQQAPKKKLFSFFNRK